MEPRPDYGDESYRVSGKLQGKGAIITGGDSGIGGTVAFAREGWHCIPLAGDIGDEVHLQDIVERAMQKSGKLDILLIPSNSQHTE